MATQGDIATLGDNWTRLTPAHAWMAADIDALREVRADIAHLYVFWHNQIGFCHAGEGPSFNHLTGVFYGVFMRVPMLFEFLFDGETPQGLVRYINTDYCDGPDLRARSRHLEASVLEVWHAIAETHAQIERKWTLPPLVARQYAAVLATALASLRRWLRTPAFSARRAREEQGDGRPFSRRLAGARR